MLHIVMKPAIAILALVLSARPALADETVQLLCVFEYGTLEITINYTRETANGSPAMISDKEIVWSPATDSNSLAIINRYTGVMQMSNQQKEFTGMCNKLVRQE
jgi:hypothetical protein